ncbi:MAG: GLUG motif-containing protein, partial [Candidatus Marinimicrobia bacterium]|nr:GLUG motif-containing protein [Candidatus Neomarinimicrobiota bacterium]
SYSTGSVSGSNYFVGGLVGENNSSTVSNSYSTGSVSGGKRVGGLVGYNNSSSTVSNSYSTGSVSGDGELGGLVGVSSSSTATNSFWDTNTSGLSSSAGGTGKTTVEMTDLYFTTNCFYQNGWDYIELTTNGTDDIWNQGNSRNSNYPYLDWQYPNDDLGLTGFNYSGGLGTESDPYQIATLEDLDSLQVKTEDWASCFVQVADINASATETWDAGSGFSSIGNDGTKFTGKYNGRGHTIDSLFIDRPTTLYIGLFGYTDGAEIDSVGLRNLDITGDYYVGGLVGWNDSSSTVSNSYSTGSVSGNASIVGGLVGYNISSTVSNSYSTGSVSGSGEYVGGLVGYNVTSSTVSNSYSTGSVSGGTYVGGLVGYNNFSSQISNSYSTGSVSGGTSRVGGLVGPNMNSSTISNCYSTGSVSAGGFGLVGYNNNSTVSNSFWDTETSGQDTSAGGTGKTTAEMQDLYFTTNCFYQSGWDFVDTTANGTDDYWNQGNAKNDDYPYLDWQYPSDSLGLLENNTIDINVKIYLEGAYK